MKIVTYNDDGARLGVLTNNDEMIIPLQALSKKLTGTLTSAFNSSLSFLQNYTESLSLANDIIQAVKQQSITESLVKLEDAKLLSPLPRPESVRDCMAFEDHIINCIRKIGLNKLSWFDEYIERIFGRERSLAYKLNKAWYERPIYYKGNRFSCVGDRAQIQMPSYAATLDYELEWAVVIGKKGKNIRAENAHEYIAGYMVFNDFSAREIQFKEQAGRLGPAKGKDFDTSNAFGPYLVTRDEIVEPYNLTMTARVNGEQWSVGTTKDMYWTFEEIIAYISQSETLYPGEVIGSGTCSGKNGKGCGLELGRSLKKGDVVECEVEAIGCLSNKII